MNAGTSSRELDYDWAGVTAISGIAGVVVYVYVIATESVDAFTLLASTMFAFGVTLSSLGLYHVLGGTKASPLVLIAAIANVIGAAILLAMILVQMSIKAVIPQPDAGLKAVWWGLDVAWDIYFSAGTILFGLSMVGRRGLGAWFGVPGVLIGALLLIFNIATFPLPPANAGLVDLGPVSGLWYVIVCARLGVAYVLVGRQRRRAIA